MTVTDRTSKVEVHFLPAGGNVAPGPAPLPSPGGTSTESTIVPLDTLIEIKLSSYLGTPVSRLRNLPDVITLIKANEAQRDLPLNLAVLPIYQQTWDALEAERLR